jgi:hypothetical protein
MPGDSYREERKCPCQFLENQLLDSCWQLAMYKHWGYELRGQDDFESTSGAFTMYSMIKEPKNAS